MYHATDPRTTLPPAPASPRLPATRFAGAEYAKFYETPPAERDDKARTWYARGQNFIVAYSEVKPGATLLRENQPDEYVVLIPDRSMGATITWEGKTSVLPGNSISFVPAGASSVAAMKSGRIVRLVTAKSKDLAHLCANAESYATTHPNVAPFEPWPNPTDGDRVRTYSLDVPQAPGRFGRIFRSSTFMVNYLEPRHGQRDPTKMSPHHHDDFEQGSLALEGAFVHYIRWPWTTDMTQWRKDEAEHCRAPSLAVIPPPAIHTSQSVNPGLNQLVDIFCPPRLDFSLRPGWVLNGDEYPLPHRT
jgi:hypothetical protein